MLVNNELGKMWKGTVVVLVRPAISERYLEGMRRITKILINLKMGKDVVSEKLENLHILMQLTARKHFIQSKKMVC